MPPRTNRLLDTFSPELQRTLSSMTRPVELPRGSILFTPGEAPSGVYFLTSGVATTVVSVADGSTAEVGVAGPDGVTGAVYLLGPQAAVAQCFMQIQGHALRVAIADARKLFTESEEFRTRILEYVQMETLLTSQLAACNKLHQSTERLARWILTAADCTGSDTLSLTQESLSQLLGTRRTTVALVAGEMQRNGLLKYRRGMVQIANRSALASIACDCYSVTRRLLQGLHRERA
ncbi:Crp/Fnr family transcriptional regulator [Terriglobus sp. TAA 43]|uniref:Crp/Fnr family transcriptional regulator n=1 Tax=Terriglobus sp. TAA 43 TaxID=278961 RepID=UPI0006455723|nr:Crp/Fnr family transcriptional regulator [Terriglobus sp. TAA 43]